MTRPLDPEVDKKLQRLFISVSMIWFAHLVLGVVIVIVAWFLSTKPQRPPLSPVEIKVLQHVLIGLSVAELAIGFFLKRRFMERFSPLPTDTPEAIFNNLAGVYSRAHLIPASLAFSTSLYGLILSVMGADKNTVVIFFIVCFVGLWLFQPRIRQLRTFASEKMP